MKGSWDRDRDPLAALSRGEQGLFEDFVRREAGTLIGFFQRLGASRTEAEDLTQEVFVKLYRHAETYQPQGNFEAFALRIARNAWIDRRRRDAARVNSRPFSQLEGEGDPLEQPAVSGGGPDAALAAREERSRIAAALRELSPIHAVIFELAVIQARPYPEIARELDIPVGTVKSRVFHAIRHLREVLGGDDAPASSTPAPSEGDLRPQRTPGASGPRPLGGAA